jgi:hypothetical protein
MNSKDGGIGLRAKHRTKTMSIATIAGIVVGFSLMVALFLYIKKVGI